ncbi:ATP-dependent helicase [Anaerococcus nagyae]|uniref:ATP-dependent helicase n=1 Tax=Anaerococcus nagyae TaxID=1755241 RepID=UPI001AE8609F|nr:ATP-dependent helicase [Anaerococcus nagyae]MBP2069569.1 DNA helicase-2/ATP-dependent DNA helicase PcrA [Anaerococcus nagyae]
MKLTEKQFQAANHINGPCLVLAVPGAGKTTMLLKRINILEKYIDPSHILSLTFSKTQANDMKIRYNGLKTNFMTIHAFCYLIIRNYYKKKNRRIKILESDDLYNKYNLIKQIYLDINGKVISSEDLDDFFSYVGYMKNSMDDISYLKNSQIKNIEKVYIAYEKFKKENFYIDFDDMQVIALKLLNEDNRLLRSVKSKYKYIQLDEGQDTSLIQFKILEKIVYPENNLMVVADDDQSIYSFRAANPDYLLNFKKIYPDSKILTMDENHRSQANIVIGSKNFIKQNQNRFKKDLYTNHPATTPIRLARLKNSKDAYKYIISHLDSNKKTAILYRNNISSLNMVSFLLKDNRDFSINNGSYDFFDSKILKDIINIISFSEDFDDVELFSNIYYMIKTYLNREDIEKLNQKPINYDIFDYLHEIVDDEKSYNLMRKEKEFKYLRKLSLDKKIAYIYSNMGYRDYIKVFSNKYYEVIINKALYVESLINFTKGLKDLDQFYEKKLIFEKILNKRNDSNLILSTIHKSKGLEYDDVFVIDLIENEFPMLLDMNDNYMRIEEERRMFYVAMTRARSNLYLLSLKNRNGMKVKASIFYEDIKNQ